MKTFYFKTGVVPSKHNPPVKLGPGQIMQRGTMVTPFDCDNVPDNATFMFACDNPNLPDSTYKGIIVRPIFNSTLCSSYAYFKTS